MIRAEICAMQLYQVADATGMIKLDAMENPYVLSDDVRTSILAVLSDTILQQGLNRYPSSDATPLKHALRDYFKIPPQYPLMLGNGSDELISLITQACAIMDDERPPVMLSPVPTFVMYQVAAQLHHLQFVGVPLRSDFSLDLPAMLAAIAVHRPRIAFLAYPNNPTGTLFAAADVQACIDLCAEMDCLVVMDEAYHAFAPCSWLDHVAGVLPPHVVVMRTVSKLGLAGVRLGYVFGHHELMVELEKIRPPYNVNALTQSVVTYLLSVPNIFAQQTAGLLAERQRLYTRLQQLSGVDVTPSEANFLTFAINHPTLSATDVFNALKLKGILIKNLSHGHALLANHLRVSIGTASENDAFLQALTETLAV
jgi:histidinol-phosphate aminotransferase